MMCISCGVRWIFAVRQYRLTPRKERVSDREMWEYIDYQRKRLRWETLTLARKMEVDRRVVRAMRPTLVFHAVRMDQLVSRTLSVSTINLVTGFFFESDIVCSCQWGGAWT